MAFFALGLERMQIVDNREWFSAETKMWSFASDETWAFPAFEGFRNLSTADQRNLVTEALRSIAQTWEAHEYENVTDNQVLQFGDTGVILYQKDYIPMSLHWSMFGLERDDDIRELGRELEAFFTNDNIDTISGAIMVAAGTAASPVTAAAVTLAKYSMKAVTQILTNNDDDQLFVIRQSFIRPLHYPTGTRHGVAVPSVLSNCYYDYFIYGLN